MHGMKLLVIEDEAKLADYLRKGLSEAGYVVEVANDGIDGLHLALEGDHDLLLLDSMLPGIDGLSLLATLRRTKQTPVLMLTARSGVEDRVHGLQSGADDYLIKPFDLDELLARMRAAARRSCERGGAELRHGDLRIDPAARRVWRGDASVELPPRAYTLLVELIRCRGRVLTRRQLEDALYPAGEEVESNAVEVHIHHLRRRLGSGLVRTVRGLGYTIDADA